jgi:Uma2 family endonuclease
MAAQPVPLTIQDFHRLYDGAKPAYEYWFGVATQKPMPTILHGIVQFIIATLLERAGWNVSLEVRLKVDPNAEPVPDVIAVRGKFKGAYPSEAPELCIEILSPSDTFPRTLEKARRYIRWGSACVWMIDPEKRTAWTLSRDASAFEAVTEPQWVSPTGVLRIGNTTIPLETLFSEVDKKLEITDAP